MSAPIHPLPARQAHAMTVDVEDYFHVQAFARTIDRASWDSLPCRVEANTDRILALLDAAGVAPAKGTVGFALTSLQRRLASSPEAIYQSLKRRRNKLKRRVEEEKLGQRGKSLAEPDAVVVIDNAKAVKWLSQGAQPTERVEKLLKQSGALDEFAAAKAAK